MAGKEFSLGAAAFGGQPAVGYAEPSETAPDTWTFPEQAGAEVRSRLFSADHGIMYCSGHTKPSSD